MPKGIFERTEQHKKALSQSKIGVKRSPETCKAISEGKKAANKRLTPEEKEAKRVWMVANAPNRGKPWGPDVKEKIRQAKLLKAPPLLYKYGVTDEQYLAEKAAGNIWCFVKKHFVSSDNFSKGSRCCKGCKSEWLRESSLRKSFGVTQQWYDEKITEQGGGCGICGGTFVAAGRKFMMVDHNHTTGLVRGVLCSNCNMAMNRLDEVPDWTTKAEAYFHKYGGFKKPPTDA